MSRAGPRAHALAIIVALVGVGGCDRDPPAAPPAAPVAAGAPAAIARLHALSGSVFLERKGQRSPARAEELHLGDAVETGPDGKAEVRFPDGRTVEVGPDARFTLGADKTGLVIEVARGLVLSRVPADEGATDGGARGPGVSLSILTPFGITRVGSGGEVAVDVRADSARVDVKLGSVEFVARNGASTRAAAGDAIDVTAGDVVLAPKGSERRPDIVLQPIQVTVVVAGGGKADIKKSGSTRWEVVGKGGGTLEAGDAVRAREGRPELALTGSRTSLSLQRGAELLFGRSERKGDVEESSFDLRKGGLTLALSSERRSRVVLGDLALESEGGGQVEVERTKDGLEVSAVTGDLILQQGEVSRKLQAGQVARLGKGTPEISEADRPALALPARSGLRLLHFGLSDLALTWEGKPGDYRVEVASDPEFTRTVASGVVHRPEVRVSPPRRGWLHWRASTPDGKTEVGRGSVYIEPEFTQKDLARLRNEVPEGPEKTTIFYQDKPPAVTFTWKREPQAAGYRVRVYRADSLTRPVTERNASDVSLPLEAGVLSEGSYLWSVTPLSKTGEEIRGGRMNKLDLDYDNSVPTLMIHSPRNGERVVGGKVRVAGVAPVGARLFINGRPVALDQKSRFDTTVTASGRSPTVIFRMSQPAAADVYTVRALKRGK